MDKHQPDGREAVAWRECYGKIIRAMAAMVNCPQTDDQLDAELIPREPIIAEVVRVKEALDAFSATRRTASSEAGFSQRFRASGDWKDYPLGTRAHATAGGYWERVPNGWKWATGATFPTPGGDVVGVSVPTAALASKQPTARCIDCHEPGAAVCESCAELRCESVLAASKQPTETERDAARYRHLAECGVYTPGSRPEHCPWGLRTSGKPSTKAELDAAIDAAMQAGVSLNEALND